MLSSILTSDRAILVNVYIIRVFTRMRQMLMTNKDILLKLEKLDRASVKHEGEIRTMFGYLQELLNPVQQPMRKIGFRQGAHLSLKRMVLGK